MQIELKRIQTEVGTTFVHVTHDQEEAMTMADTVAVMNSGRIEQMGHPADIYELPRTVFVANFLGQSNLFKGKKSGMSGEDIVVSANGLRFALPAARCFTDGDGIIVGVRPEKMRVLDAADAAEVPEHHNRITGRVSDVSYMGVSTQYLVMTPWDQEITVFEQNVVVGDRSEVGDDVVIHWSPRHTFGLDGSEDLTVGVDPEVLELEAVNQALVADDSAG
jgi:spermidine/putrescine transport system ATP-binding protein